jgi:hypothetical protein
MCVCVCVRVRGRGFRQRKRRERKSWMQNEIANPHVLWLGPELNYTSIDFGIEYAILWLGLQKWSFFSQEIFQSSLPLTSLVLTLGHHLTTREIIKWKECGHDDMSIQLYRLVRNLWRKLGRICKKQNHCYIWRSFILYHIKEHVCDMLYYR